MPRKDKESQRQYMKKWRPAARKRVQLALFAMYGSTCAGCGEKDIIVLTLDRIHDGGNKHRKEKGSSLGVWHDALKENDPNKYRILCANCQMRAYKGLLT